MPFVRSAFSFALAVSITCRASPLPAAFLYAQQPPLPIVYICTMHGDILDSEPSICPICKMNLQPVRLETAWSCPVHAAVIEEQRGTCLFDGRELVSVTINHFWVCRENDMTLYANPGQCVDLQPRQEKKVVRAHGDHNPRHGGQFFMAADQWHHLEGTYSAPQLFRLYVYDNFTNPIDSKKVTGRVFTHDGAGRELGSVDLIPSRDGMSLEARIDGRTLPQTVTAKVKFAPDAPDEQFDFTFPEFTEESAAGAKRGGSTLPSVTGRAPTSAPNLTDHTGQALPTDISETITLLEIRTREVRTLIEQGNFTTVYVPTMLAKDLALALADRTDEFTSEIRNRMLSAVKRVVLAAWNLDRFGDLGNRARLVDAYEEFARAIAEIKAAYERV